jgi:hypothetical protein
MKTPAHLQDGILKVFSNHDWQGLVTDCGGRLVTMFERGHLKSAASDVFSKKDLDDHNPPPGQFMIHQIVMGGEDKHGMNSNGDAWPSEGLKRDHPTFVTHGKVYREHRNSRPDQAIGEIKAAKYNQRMDRVEVLKWLDMDKAAAEYEKAKAGKELHASMSARVPFDSCSVCEKKARNTSLYCDHLANHMGEWMPEFSKYAFARNPVATYFDSSVVENPAARMAKHIEYRFGGKPGLQKAASNGKPRFSGAQWAEFEGVRQRRGSPLLPAEASILRKLAALEGSPADAYRMVTSKCAFAHDQKVPAKWEETWRLAPGTFFRKLASRSVLLPFDVFMSYITAKPLAEVYNEPTYKQAAAALPSVFRAIADAMDAAGMDDDDGDDDADDNDGDDDSDDVGSQQDVDAFACCGHNDAACDPESDDSIDQLMDQAGDQWSTDPGQVQSRSMKVIVIKSAARPDHVPPCVRARDIPSAALLYGLYKIAACRDILRVARNPDERLLLACAVDQNITSTFS